MSEKILCSVCIATYKRPQFLFNLITSLLAQELDENISIEIIIVDNDPAASAEHIVSEFQNVENRIIKYFKQPIKNISITRNIGLKNCSGNYIAFIDDDETAGPNWIKTLIDCSNKYNADVVFGYVIPIFDECAPDWLKQRELYFRPLGSTGSEPNFWYTTNCIIKSNIVKENGILFDEGRGLTGGEDGLFFRTLKENFGAKFICCQEAITYEVVPQKRLNVKYLLSRNFQIGNLYAKRILSTKNGIILINWIFLFIKFTLLTIFYSLLSIFYYTNKKRWIFYYVSLFAAFGKLSGLFNYNYEHYRVHE
ncbi:MAG: hypothetical protein KatS3mg002_1557 [Candidatus Woesearchaeota archaeon]|nr:MAG: hypothetical protein KatS3mg002_1557 [Candidatus Woesearchaeota archaeon]